MRHFDIFLLFQFFIILFYIGCTDNRLDDSIYDLILKVEPRLSYDIYLETLSNESSIYNTTDLIEFLGHYGNCVQDIIPAFNNYHQDITVGGSFLGQISKVNGQVFVGPSGNVLVDTTGYQFNWYANSDLIYSGVNPIVNNVFLCSGVFEMRLEIITPIKAEFNRTEWIFLGSSSDGFTCPCNDCPCQFCVFYDFYPSLPPLYFLDKYPKWDLNEDGCITSSDLMLFLANFGM